MYRESQFATAVIGAFEAGDGKYIDVIIRNKEKEFDYGCVVDLSKHDVNDRWLRDQLIGLNEKSTIALDESHESAFTDFVTRLEPNAHSRGLDVTDVQQFQAEFDFEDLTIETATATYLAVLIGAYFVLYGADADIVFTILVSAPTFLLAMKNLHDRALDTETDE